MSKAIVVHDLIDKLPFHEALGWEKFQTLCTDVLYKAYNSIDSREYLSKGNSQQGIDVYAVKRGERKMTVAQCKLTEYLGPQSVLDLVDEFLKGTLVESTNEFILCTSFDLTRQRDEEKTIAECRRKLAEKNIDFIVWDESGLSIKLRTEPSEEIINIVYRYFGEDIASGFYGNIWQQYINKLKAVKKRSYPLPQDYIERKIVSYNEQLTNKKATWNFWYNESKNTLLGHLQRPTNEVSKRVVLLSTAGFGKTEELNNLAGFFSQEERITYPIKFSLRDYEGQSIEVILSSYDVNWMNIPRENMLLLFDGLDEVTEHHFQTFINHLNAFVEQNQNVQVVVSSRFNFYDVNFPPLRQFEIFILYPLSNDDTTKYITEKLGNSSDEFIDVLRRHGFYEYIQNPYYLTRLVRFFNNKEIVFPKNKTELFDRILFEQLEKDEGTYNIKELKEKLMPLAKQIAFDMTVAGKSTLTDNEIKTIIPEQESRRLLNHFSILNRNATEVGTWSFEHKNLQEYLSAAVFSTLSFEKIHSIISFKHDAKKLLPRFLNTISFLFEFIDKDAQLFQDLFAWINDNEPELLVRFEREQLSKQTRNNIFFEIFNYYKAKNITLRVSSNFSHQELAWFVEIDDVIIDFLSGEIKSGIADELVYDSLSIIGYCPRAFVFRQKIEDMLYWILKADCPAFLKAKAISTLSAVGFLEETVFEKILGSGIDLTNAEIRKSCIYFLDLTAYYENYAEFILGSIEILELDQKVTNISGSFFSLKRLILKFTSPVNVKQIFRYALIDRNLIKRHSYHREFHFDLGEVKTLMDKATESYKTDKSILPVVYRLFCGFEYPTHDKEWFAPFRSFFEMTCGIKVIFDKFYRYSKRDTTVMAFADRECCDFLIKEYQLENIDDKQIGYYRNYLSHLNWDLFLYFYDQLKILGEGQFIIPDVNVNYNEVRERQEIKNQQMLLDRVLFMEEANIIFSLIDKENIKTEDLWYSENVDLRKYQNSLVLETIRNMCVHDDEKMITAKEFIDKYSDDEEWKGFVIDSIKSLLENKNVPTVEPALLGIASAWCIDKVESLDFAGSIKDVGESFQYVPIVEYVKDLFLLLDIKLEDKLLLKMLPSDYQSYYGWTNDESKTISSVIVKDIQNKDALRNAVMSNIKSNQLAALVLCSHFAICHKLGYKECLPFLFNTINSNPLLTDHNRIKLTEYYFDLGGERADFKEHLKMPATEIKEHIEGTWQWFIIEQLLFVASDKIAGILMQILTEHESVSIKLSAAENLIKLSRIEGLKYAASYLKDTGNIPFEHHWSNLQEYIATLPTTGAIDLFFSMLEFSYENNYQNKHRGEHEIAQSCFESLSTLSLCGHDYYLKIKDRLNKMIEDSQGRSFKNSLIYYSERFNRRYYESQAQEIDIASADLIFKSFST